MNMQCRSPPPWVYPKIVDLRANNEKIYERLHVTIVMFVKAQIPVNFSVLPDWINVVLF